MVRRIAAVLGLVLLLATAPGGAAEAIRVGYLGPLTGIFAAAGRDMLDGLRMAFEQVNYEVAGRKIELVEEDDEGNPATAQAKYRKLVAQDRIHVLDGVLLINIGYALVPNIERDRLPSLFLTTPDEITKRKPTKYVLRSNFSASQPMHALGDYAAKTLRYKRVAAIAMDNGFGHEGVGGFQRVFEDQGGRVVQKVWAPLNAMDFAPYLSQVPRDADAVVQVFVAGQAVRFAKQYGESALHGKVPLIGTGVFTDQSSLQGMGDEVIGHVGALIWAPTIDNAANRAFVSLAEAKVKRTPSYFHAVMYSSGRWIIEAAKALGGNVEDRDRFLAALRRATDTTPDPRGPIKLDEYGNPTQNVYIVKVEKLNGRLQNTVIHTYPMVSQFWTYKPEEFLKTPPYDRTYPPIKP
ncbi:MAG TPA: ABC transporter substrate-binding protein [Methylomirabilota bacterium]|jgi:branched-chain amino acid transport system substrate-binding protein|nr:ABC transporter substrate-binding protein [Methylomirabilota bacterium]